MKEIPYKKETLIYIFALVIYLGIGFITSLFNASLEVSLAIKLLVVGSYLLYFKKHFSCTYTFNLLAIGVGIFIGILWVVLDPLYMPSQEITTTYSTLAIVLRFGTGLLLAPILEEFFTRYFLHRFLESPKWLTIPQGTYALMPFIVTTLFFGLSHDRWLAGILTGVILNLLWYKQKNMNGIIIAHAVANLVLGILVVSFGLYQFW